MTHKLIETALLEQLVEALEFEASLYTRNSEDGLPYHLREVITAGRAALANAEPIDKEILNLLRGEQMLSAITVLLNVAAFGSTPLYEDGSETENRLLQLKTAKFLHSLHSDEVFEEEHEWLLNQVKLHERYAEPTRNVTKAEDAALHGALLRSGKVVRTEIKNTYMKKAMP